MLIPCGTERSQGVLVFVRLDVRFDINDSCQTNHDAPEPAVLIYFLLLFTIPLFSPIVLIR